MNGPGQVVFQQAGPESLVSESWLPCGPGPAVTFATNSFLAPVDGPELGEAIHMRMGKPSASLLQLVRLGCGGPRAGAPGSLVSLAALPALFSFL